VPDCVNASMTLGGMLHDGINPSAGFGTDSAPPVALSAAPKSRKKLKNHPAASRWHSPRNHKFAPGTLWGFFRQRFVIVFCLTFFVREAGEARSSSRRLRSSSLSAAEVRDRNASELAACPLSALLFRTLDDLKYGRPGHHLSS